MKRVNREIFTICLTAVLSGCSAYYPISVDESNIKQRLEKSEFQGIPVAETQYQAMENMKTYADWYLLKSNDLKKASFRFSDGSLGMTIAGLAAGFADKPKGAAEAIFLSNMLDIPSSRYQIEVQSTNYEKASDAMLCMYQSLKPTMSKKLQKENNFNEWLDVPDVSFLNKKINDVKQKLRNVQNSVTLAKPDIAKIESAIMEKLTKKSGGRSISDEKARSEFESDLEKCIAEF
ncbi:lipoprotein [Thiothrix nivea]|uniref:Lipoprotein n=1 Tax=Thiothrix nivea (strain ATCC 35100 / DSM 5205 / JP2) TaxID=870187 RepID=A0A656HHU8_THINJ|nr:lipoprotein [Thiothrix nivea]EIJ34605.1 hypothetical protein Thini_2032 [Thiothrix nivea DSM 5205]